MSAVWFWVPVSSWSRPQVLAGRSGLSCSAKQLHTATDTPPPPQAFLHVRKQLDGVVGAGNNVDDEVSPPNRHLILHS